MTTAGGEVALPARTPVCASFEDYLWALKERVDAGATWHKALEAQHFLIQVHRNGERFGGASHMGVAAMGLIDSDGVDIGEYRTECGDALQFLPIDDVWLEIMFMARGLRTHDFPIAIDGLRSGAVCLTRDTRYHRMLDGRIYLEDSDTRPLRADGTGTARVTCASAPFEPNTGTTAGGGDDNTIVFNGSLVIPLVELYASPMLYRQR